VMRWYKLHKQPSRKKVQWLITKSFFHWGWQQNWEGEGSERETKAVIKLMKYVITFMYNLFSFPFHWTFPR
jgi:hypothetical protein